MASIPTYERQTRPGGGTIGIANFQSSGTDLSGIARGVQAIGAAVHQEDEFYRQKTEDHAALAAANALSAGDEFWNQRATELKQDWQVGGEDLRKTSGQEFKTWKQEQMKALPTEKSRMWFDQHAERMRSRLDQDLFNYQDRATTEKVVSDSKLGMDADAKVLETAPDRFDEVTTRRVAAIQAQTRIPEGKRAEMAMAYLKDMAYSVEYGDMKRDPAAWLAKRMAPKAAEAAPASAPDNRGTTFDALLQQESGGSQMNADGTVKTSPKGAIGIAQIMPTTGPEAAKLAGLPWDENRLRTDSEYNKALGNAYFAKQLDTFGGDVQKALAAYNMGPGSKAKGNGVAGLVDKYGDEWLAHAPAETQNYVRSITANAGAAQAQTVAVSPQPSSGAGVSISEDAPKTFRAQDLHRQYQMLDEAQRLVNQQQAQQKGEADRLLSDALAMHKDGKTDPFNLTPEYFNKSYGPIEGPIKAAAYRGGRDMASDIQNFAGQTDAQIQATLQASAPVAGEGYAAADARQQVRLQAAQNVVKQRQEDPQAYAVRYGLSKAAQMDMSDPQGMVAEINKRVGVAQMMSDTYGTPYRVLMGNEASQMSQAIRLLPTQQKLDYLDRIRTGTYGNNRAFLSVMNQVAPDSPVTAVAGSILIAQMPVTVSGGLFGSDSVLQPRNVSGLMLEGEALLNPTKADKAQDGRGAKFPMPKEADLQQAFNDYAGKAFRGDGKGYETAYQAFKAYYAGSANRKGILSTDLTTEGAKIAKEAAAAATGGVINYNTLGEVMKPWGMDDGTFKNRASAEFDKAMVSNGMKGSAFDNLSAYGLQSVGTGRYLLTNGAGYLNGPNGPIELDLTRAPNTPHSASGRIKGAP
jgi:soluble lytic murein transglycosylase-like protein